MSVTVVLIDDHAVVRDGLRALLASQDDLEVVGCSGDGLKGLELVRELAPDVVVVDVTLPGLNGVEIARQISGSGLPSRVCALTMHTEAGFIRGMSDAGAAGYVCKSAPFDAVIDAIRAIAAGSNYYTPEARAVIEEGWDPDGATLPVSDLTPRERQVLQLIAEGASSKQAAGALRLSKKTVDHHRQSVMGKLDLHSVAELTKFAVRHGLTPIDGADEG